VSTIDSCFARAAEDRRRGAAEIELELLDALLRRRREWSVEALTRGAARLRSGQPTMANLINLTRGIVDDDLSLVEQRLESRASLLSELDERLAAAAWPVIEGTGRVLTISRSSAVKAVVIGSWRRGWRGETVVFDGSPAGGGADQARLLGEAVGRVRSQPDATVPRWLGGEGVLVLVGADAVGPERFVNVCGTATLLELAAARSIPGVVIADSGKDLPGAEIDDLIVSGPETSEAGTGRRWPLFEAVPLELVSRRIRE
jgi:translation initiation factor 2B subunit (eIF-2B alpha/beta/delta family)